MIRISLLIVLFFILSGCASTFGTLTQAVYFTSDVPNVRVEVDGQYIGEAPTVAELSKKHKIQEVTFIHEELGEQYFYIKRYLDAKWLFLDLLFWPSIFIDMLTPCWYYLDATEVTAIYNSPEYQGPNWQSVGNGISELSVLVSSGTGFLVSPNGYIATNYHVVEPGHRYEVYLPKGDETVSYTIILP